MHRLIVAALLLLFAEFNAAPAHAQPPVGTVTGVVTDTSGGVVPQALITADHIVTHRIETAHTDASGRYTLVLAPGEYELRVRSDGFTDDRRDIRIIVGETLTADAVIQVGAFAERTSATASAPVSRSEVSLASTALPAAVTVIQHDELERTNLAQDVGTIFRRVPGVLAHNINQGETGTAIKLRGFSSSTHGADTAVYIDGISQNVPSSAINHGMNDMSWLTPDMIERVEVIKGPFSALYGDQNRAGAVNIVTRAAATNSIAGTFGSFGNKRLSAVFSRTVGQGHVLLVGDLFDIRGYRDNDRDTRGTGFGKFWMQRGTSVWTIRGMYNKADWDAPGFLNVDGVISGAVRRTDRDPSAPQLFGEGDRRNVVLTRAPAKGEAGLHLSMAAERYQRTRALGANATDYNVQSDDRWFAQARLVENLAVSRRASLALGGELRHDRGDSINQRWPAGVPGATYSWNQDLTLSTYAVFAQGQVKPVEMVKLIGGVRYDAFDYTINNRKLPAASMDYSKSVATPRGGISVTPNTKVELFANVGQGFRSPNQSELSPSGSVGPLGAAGGAPFPQLAVPRVRSYDGGATIGVAERWTLTVARYHTFNENEIIQVAPGVFSAVGDTVRDGWDMEGRITVTTETSLYGSLSEITRATINNPPPNSASLFLVPRHMVKGGVGHTLHVSGARLLLNADGYYMSGIPYFTGAPLFLSGVSRPYSRFDVRGTYERGQVQYTAYSTLQPQKYSSEPLSVIAAGVFYDPRPRAEFGVTVRYRY